jgi:3-oxoadipate enol-lactonase
MPKIQINGISLHYSLKGNADSSEAVVFLNGLMSSVSSWMQQVPAFEKAGYKILLHDFRGQLLSERPVEKYSFAQHARDLKELLDQLGVKKIHIVSTSYGALVGMRFTLDFPDYVKSLSMIDALSELDANFRCVAQTWQALLKEGDMVKFFQAAAPFIYSNTYLENNEASSKERDAQLAQLPKEYLESLNRLVDNTMANANVTAVLSKITCPVLLACGENDILTPLKFSKLIQQKIPHAELYVVPDCGHSTISERPDAVNTLTLGFIGKHSG